MNNKDRAEFLIKLIENIIFTNEKDIGINNVNQLRLKYNYLGLDLDYTNIYRRIVNYRVKKYGTSKICGNYIMKPSILLKVINKREYGYKDSKEIHKR